MIKKDINYTKELIELKYDVLIKRINKLENIFTIVLTNTKSKEKIKIIKEQYNKMYQEILIRQEYNKYPEVEKAIIKSIGKLELDLEIYLTDTYKTIKNPKIITDTINQIYNSEDWKQFKNLEKELEKVQASDQLLELILFNMEPEEKEQCKETLRELKETISKKIKFVGVLKER